MSEVLELSSSPAGDELSVALGELSAVVDRLLGVDLSGVAAGVLEGGLRELVVQSRRLPAVRNALVADAIGRGVPSSRSAASPAGGCGSCCGCTRGRPPPGSGTPRTWSGTGR